MVYLINMKLYLKSKKFLAIFIGILILTFFGFVNAGMLIPASEKAKENAQAPGKSPVITESSGEWWLDLERVDFVHYVKPVNPGKPGKNETCYKLMGVKWADIDLPVDYVINPTNPKNLSENFIISAISTSTETWDNATSKELFDNYSEDYNAQYGVQDFKNVIAFGNYPQSGVIAITSIWYTRIGKRIVEFDILFDTDWIWGNADSDSNVMDLQNIATHEFGHAVGLNDVYNTVCSEVTMYGYSNYGETKKRTLEQADIIGLQKIYGM